MMKGQSHLGILLGMNMLTGVQLLCLNTPDFGESCENACERGWGGLGGVACLDALLSSFTFL